MFSSEALQCYQEKVLESAVIELNETQPYLQANEKYMKKEIQLSNGNNAVLEMYDLEEENLDKNEMISKAISVNVPSASGESGMKVTDYIVVRDSYYDLTKSGAKVKEHFYILKNFF